MLNIKKGQIAGTTLKQNKDIIKYLLTSWQISLLRLIKNKLINGKTNNVLEHYIFDIEKK